MTERELAASLIGDSDAMRGLRESIVKLAPSPLAILIQGPTGVGKELVAHAIHRASGLVGPFVSCNVSSIPETMFADAMFGHVRGAFTNAVTSTAGYMTEAHGGTLLMDEISRLVLPNQITLLRVLETHTFRPIGGRDDRRSDFRVLSATNESLSWLVQRDQFREDLFYRLRMATIVVPSLRERRDDIPLLAEHFASRVRSRHQPVRFAPCAMRWLQEYDWPGNVRQLRSVVEAAVYLTDTTVLDQSAVRRAVVDDEQGTSGGRGRISRAELVRLLEHNQGDVSAVAVHCGKAVGTIYRWLREHGIPTWERRRMSRAPQPGGPSRHGMDTMSMEGA